MSNKDVGQLVMVDTVEEANEYLSKSWALIESVSYVVDNEPKFKFVLGRTAYAGILELSKMTEEELTDWLDSSSKK